MLWTVVIDPYRCVLCLQSERCVRSQSFFFLRELQHPWKKNWSPNLWRSCFPLPPVPHCVCVCTSSSRGVCVCCFCAPPHPSPFTVEQPHRHFPLHIHCHQRPQMAAARLFHRNSWSSALFRDVETKEPSSVTITRKPTNFTRLTYYIRSRELIESHLLICDNIT